MATTVAVETAGGLERVGLPTERPPHAEMWTFPGVIPERPLCEWMRPHSPERLRVEGSGDPRRPGIPRPS